MGNPGPVEDILSDEYEEGEIRDDDIIYENVSSLEEISDEEFVESKPSKDERKSRRRKKEHKCKEDSLCRKERTGKHCYARIRKFSPEKLISKPKSKAREFSTAKRSDEKSSSRFTVASTPRANTRRGTFSKTMTDLLRKSHPRRKQPAYFSRKEPVRSLKKIALNRQNRKPAGNPLKDRGYHRKRRSRSTSPVNGLKNKKLDSNRAVTKSSLLDRLVGSGSIPFKNQIGCDSDDIDGKVNHSAESGDDLMMNIRSTFSNPENYYGSIQRSGILSKTNESVNRNIEAAFLMKNISPEDIPIPPTPKNISPLQEPQKEDIDEVELRVYALKTAIMKKYSVLKRKKNLARSSRSKTSDSYEDSFTELALMDIGETLDDGNSSATPPPPGVEEVIMDVASERSSQGSPQCVVSTDEGLSNEILIAPDMSRIAERSPSRNKLPCCSGKPIPVVSPHRPAKDVDWVRPALNHGNVVSIPISMEMSPPIRTPGEKPKYLKEINSNQKGSAKKNWPAARGSGKKQNSIRRRTLSISRRSDRLKESKLKRARPENDEDEDELRKLALMSVKPKNSISEGMLARVDVNPLTVQTDSTIPDDEMKESPAKSIPADETWENLDEDILRAQLLSALSQKIPSAPENIFQSNVILPSNSVITNRRLVRKTAPVRKPVMTKKLNKENVYSKTNVNLLAKPRNLNKYVNPTTQTMTSMNSPVVNKFIIRVGDSESSEDEQAAPVANDAVIVHNFDEPTLEKSEIELKIDYLLETTRKETELIQKASIFYPPYEVPPEPLPPVSIVQEITNAESCEQVSEDKDEEIFGLTAWQQKEFERQKKASANKQNVIKAAKKKIKTKNIEKTENPNDLKKEISDGSSCDASLDKSMPSLKVKNDISLDIHTHDDNEERNILFEEPCQTTSRLEEPSGNSDSPNLISSIDSDSNQILMKNEPILTKAADHKTAVGIPELISESEDIKDLLCSIVNRVSLNLDIGSVDHRIDDSVRTATDFIATSESTIMADNSPVIKYKFMRESETDARSQNETTCQPSEEVATVAPLKLDGSLEPKVDEKLLKKIETSGKDGKVPKNGELLKNKPPHHTQSPLQVKQNNQPKIKKSTYNDSSFVQKAIDGVASLVDRFEADVADYRNCRKECAILRRKLSIAHQQQDKRRKALLVLKKEIETKNKLLQPIVMMDMSSLSPLPDTKEELKQPKRTAEFVKLKYKEVCLRAHLVTMGFEGGLKRPITPVRTAVNDSQSSPRKRMKFKKSSPVPVAPTNSKPLTQVTQQSPVASTSKKLVVSVRDKDEMDPEIPLCPYDRHGVCMDEECKYQHLRP